jgi:hypothetical protein
MERSSKVIEIGVSKGTVTYDAKVVVGESTYAENQGLSAKEESRLFLP